MTKDTGTLGRNTLWIMKNKDRTELNKPDNLYHCLDGPDEEGRKT